MTSARPHIAIAAESLTKKFRSRAVIRDLSMIAEPNAITVLAGPNGSGKSTLLKLLARVLSPTSGACRWMDGDRSVSSERETLLRGFVAPYLELYDELTGSEQLQFVAKLKQLDVSEVAAREVLTGFGLDRNAIDDRRPLRTYSSGMKQRVRIAMAAIGEPPLLFLDEPSSNLDEAGIAMLEQFVQRARATSTVVIATNDAHEMSWADQIVRLT